MWVLNLAAGISGTKRVAGYLGLVDPCFLSCWLQVRWACETRQILFFNCYNFSLFSDLTFEQFPALSESAVKQDILFEKRNFTFIWTWARHPGVIQIPEAWLATSKICGSTGLRETKFQFNFVYLCNFVVKPELIFWCFNNFKNVCVCEICFCLGRR